MSKSIKLSNNIYFDSSSISHNRVNLKTHLNNLDDSIEEINTNYDKLETFVNNMYIIDSFEQFTGAIESGDTVTLNYNNINNKEGYIPIAITGIHCTGTRSSFINIYAWLINDSYQGRVIFRNTHSSNPLVKDNTKIVIYVLYIKAYE